MNVLLVGLYGLGCQPLAALHRKGVRVTGVVTKPSEEPAQQEFFSLVRDSRLPLLLPDSPNEPGFSDSIRALQPDVIAVAGYHKRLPGELLRIPSRGCINTHLSLLPKYRGPCPWKWALIRGERTTGVTVHVMTPRFDRGPLLAQREVFIGEEETGGMLFHRLCSIGSEVLAETLVNLQAGQVSASVQDEKEASYQSAPTDGDARIRWELGSREICNLVRGLCPRPGAWTNFEGKRLRILKASPGPAPDVASRPGTILAMTDLGPSVCSGDGTLILRELAAEGTLPLRPGGLFE